VSALPVERGAVVAASLAASEVAKRFGDHAALDGVSLEVAAGERVVLVGPSGAGKSVLLRVMLGLERASAGRVRLFGEDPASAAGRRLVARVGVLLERDALFADRSVEENVALGVRDGRSREAVRRAAREALLLVGVKHREHGRPAALAPGERRRVALARAVAGGPALLWVDEPGRGLDPVAAGALHALLGQLRARLGLALVVTSADPRALEGADRAGFLHRGRLGALEPPERLRERPDAALQQWLAGRPHGPIAP